MNKPLCRKMDSMSPLLLITAFVTTVTVSFALIAVIAQIKHTRYLNNKANEVCLSGGGFNVGYIPKLDAYECYDKDGNDVKFIFVNSIDR